jgi:hypothetical protein
MNKNGEENYFEREEDDRVLAREFDLMFLEKMIQSVPPKERTEKFAVVGAHVFSMEDMLNEVREGTIYGEMIRAMLKEIRLAKLRVGK